MIVCTPCLNELKGAELRQMAAYKIAGYPGSPWHVQEGNRKLGPFPTDELCALLAARKIDFLALVWRDGTLKWKPAAQMFTIPALEEGRCELRDFGQGHGRYRPPYAK